MAMNDLHSSPKDVACDAPRILIVEPNRRYLGVLARRVGEAGYRVATADSVKTAFAELHRLDVQIVLSELRLPGTDGVDLVRMIRQDAVLGELPVLLIAGRSHSSAACVQAFNAGADDVIVKPFAFDVLIARIARELDRARAVRRLRDDNEALDARVVGRAIQLGEMRDRWLAAESERKRLEELVARTH